LGERLIRRVTVNDTDLLVVLNATTTLCVPATEAGTLIVAVAFPALSVLTVVSLVVSQLTVSVLDALKPVIVAITLVPTAPLVLESTTVGGPITWSWGSLLVVGTCVGCFVGSLIAVAVAVGEGVSVGATVGSSVGAAGAGAGSSAGAAPSSAVTAASTGSSAAGVASCADVRSTTGASSASSVNARMRTWRKRRMPVAVDAIVNSLSATSSDRHQPDAHSRVQTGTRMRTATKFV
jgi:hypothetical protein